MDELESFLRNCIATEERRVEVREACGASLDDLRRCELEDLEEVLPLNTWPPLVRRRFLNAWRALNEDDAVADTDEEEDEEPVVAPPQPPSPAIAPAPEAPRPPSPEPADTPLYEVGDQVEARWRGGAKYYAALVLVVRVDGSCDLQYTDGDFESRVDSSLLRPLARRRRAAGPVSRRVAPVRAPVLRRAPPAPVAEAEPSDTESEPSAPAPAEPEPTASPTEEPVAPEPELVLAPMTEPAPAPAPIVTEPDEPASPTDEPEAPAPPTTLVVEPETTLAPPAERPLPVKPAPEPAEVPTAEPTAPAPPVAEPASAPDSPSALIMTEPEPAEVPMAVEPEPAPAPAVERTPSPGPVDPVPMETTAPPPPPHDDDDDDYPVADASAMDVDAPVRPAALDRTLVDAADAASVLRSIGAEMVRTVDLGTRSNKRPTNVDWRLAHTYSFLRSLRALGDNIRGALTEALLKGQRGEISPDVARRAVARILGGDLRMLEKFQHTLRPQSAPLASEATVSWFDPATGLDLYAYSSCGAAAKEWGVRATEIRECVEGKVLFVNGLNFRRQTRWPVPAGAISVSRGVLRVGDRYRVQLGHDWGFLGNSDSACAAALVHAAAQQRLTQARRIREAHTMRQLTEGATIDLGGCYILLRSLASGRSFPRGFSVRKHRVPFAPFEEKAHDAYFVSRRRGKEVPYGAELVYAQVHPPQRDLTFWDPRAPNRGLSAQRLSVRATAALSGYTGYQYRLVKRSNGDAAAVDGNDASLVQLWRRSAVEAAPAPVPAVPPPPADWAQCAQCDKWRVLPANVVSVATLSDAWSCSDINIACSKVACSLEDADCLCYMRDSRWDVVLLSSAGAITATYCSPAGAAAALGITWQDAQRRCSSKGSSKARIETAVPPVLRYATAWADEFKRREAASATAEKRRAAQQAAAARRKDVSEAAAAADAAMAALAKPAEWAQCSACEKWRVLPEGISSATLSDAWTCADIGFACSKVACSLVESADCECHAPGFDREVVSVSPEGQVVATYCSPWGAGFAHGMARDRAVGCINSKQVSKVTAVLRDARAWAEEVRSRKAERDAAAQRPRVTCTLCRKTRVVPPGVTIDDQEGWTCADAPDDWLRGATSGFLKNKNIRLSCKTRQCSTGMSYCPCQAGNGRGVDQTSDDGVVVRHCSIAACARSLYPDAPDSDLWKSNVISAIEKGRPYANKDDQRGGAFKGLTFMWARQDCAYCASGANPDSILLCDGDNCANEAHFHCAGLDAIPSDQWFCCDACEANPAPVVRSRSAPAGDRRGRCGECEGYLADDCGTCKFCLDQTKRGGPNTLRRPCILRRCEQVYDDSRARFRLAQGAATPTAEEVDEPGPGSRVWALFDDASLTQAWWGGTIISISGVADEMRYDVVFDDGQRQGVYTAHVFHSPPDERLPVSGPNAKAKALLEKALPKPPKRPAAVEATPPRPNASPPRPQTPTGNCPVYYEPFQSGDVKSFNCGHHLCGTCSEGLARHKAEEGVNTTRQGVQVSCPLCRKKARI